MSTEQKIYMVMDLPSKSLAPLFAPFLLAWLLNHFPLVTMSNFPLGSHNKAYNLSYSRNYYNLYIFVFALYKRFLRR